MRIVSAIAFGGLKPIGECMGSAGAQMLLNAVLDFDRQLASRAG